MADNDYGPGFPIDPISLRKIGQAGIFSLDENNQWHPIGPLNPLFSLDFIDAVSQGKVPGWRFERKFASSPNVGTTQQPLWPSAAAFKFLESAEKILYTSASGLDTLAGTGAQIIQHKGMLADNTVNIELVNMNGVVGTLTEFEYLRPFRTRVVQGGISAADVIVGIEDSKGAAGLITGTTEITGKPQVFVAQGKNITTQLVFRVPTGEAWHILRTFASASSGKEVDIKSFLRTSASEVFEVATEANFFESVFTSRIFSNLLEPLTDFIVTAKSSASGTGVSAIIDILVNENFG